MSDPGEEYLARGRSRVSASVVAWADAALRRAKFSDYDDRALAVNFAARTRTQAS